uniref:N-acetyltransferase domain-containing protein n=1 Tax=Chromera velia CCMP2878 TaxID=1169474 RepID=A0A0G4FH03_9ALVE|eukprot:Cvel_16889.t1-p1 / transcript=Cvel_16889.t1 / gene=Cvel_16889 / organism=Chromera_velia_CCMP2878 / gene_product=hypothetical protein / transcript_product=hypothetical protein / location=Cvel_scaffold1322:13250-15408(+) / protein_length=219 / sequence_SO=supercontig / SO=protein_coding / is_pseudo=false
MASNWKLQFVPAAELARCLDSIRTVKALLLEAFGEDSDIGRSETFKNAEGREVIECLLGFHSFEATSFLILWNRGARGDQRDWQAVGAVQFVNTVLTVYVCSLAVKPSHRNRGIAGGLLKEVAVIAADQLGIRQATGTVESRLTHLVRYYTRLGGEVDASASAGSAPPALLRIHRTIKDEELEKWRSGTHRQAWESASGTYGLSSCYQMLWKTPIESCP